MRKAYGSGKWSLSPASGKASGANSNNLPVKWEMQKTTVTNTDFLALYKEAVCQASLQNTILAPSNTNGQNPFFTRISPFW